jgi:predicted dehydrogenase
MKVTPYVSGSGMAGKGMAKALGIISVVNPDLQIQPVIQLKRDQSLHGLASGVENPVLFIANPHGYHAAMILEGEASGFKHMVCDKPVCVSKEDVSKLQNVKTKVAVTHGFRQNWGPQTIKKMIDTGEFGEVISIEGRYWQSSMAEAAVSGSVSSKDWKNDRKLNGPYDALVDLGAHYTDMMLFFAGEKPVKSAVWVSHVNSPASHRDSHAHVEFIFPKFRARGSISKTVHGTGNDLEITVLGQKQTVTWHVERPDELKVAKGATTTLLHKLSDKFGSQQPPFHGAGWLEGYIDVIHSYLLEMAGHKTSYPTLQDSVRVMDVLLNAEIR